MTTNVVPLRYVPEWTFGERLRKIRRESGLGQVEFANRLGVGDKALAAWESGRTKPKDIVAIAKILRREFGVPTSWTLGTEEGMPSGGGPEGGGGVSVRREGIEPPTRWFEKSPSHNGFITIPQLWQEAA